MLLFCGCSNSKNKISITPEYTCEFSCGDTTGNIRCDGNSVIFSDISVGTETVGIVVSVTSDRYTVATANAKAEYLFGSGKEFPLAEFGQILLTASQNGNSSVKVDKNGFITSVTTGNGTTYTLQSHKKTQ